MRALSPIFIRHSSLAAFVVYAVFLSGAATGQEETQVEQVIQVVTAQAEEVEEASQSDAATGEASAEQQIEVHAEVQVAGEDHGRRIVVVTQDVENAGAVEGVIREVIARVHQEAGGEAHAEEHAESGGHARAEARAFMIGEDGQLRQLGPGRLRYLELPGMTDGQRRELHELILRHTREAIEGAVEEGGAEARQLILRHLGTDDAHGRVLRLQRLEGQPRAIWVERLEEGEDGEHRVEVRIRRGDEAGGGEGDYDEEVHEEVDDEGRVIRIRRILRRDGGDEGAGEGGHGAHGGITIEPVEGEDGTLQLRVRVRAEADADDEDGEQSHRYEYRLRGAEDGAVRRFEVEEVESDEGEAPARRYRIRRADGAAAPRIEVQSAEVELDADEASGVRSFRVRRAAPDAAAGDAVERRVERVIEREDDGADLEARLENLERQVREIRAILEELRDR